MSLAVCSHSRQLVGCQMPNFFSRIAGLSPRVSTASAKLFAIVSATVSTAGPAMPVPSSVPRFDVPASRPVLIAVDADGHLTPRFLLFPAPFSSDAGFLGAEVELLDVPGMHQSLAGVVHDDPADLQHIAIMRGLKRDFGILLDQQDRHALFFVDTANDGKNLLHRIGDRPSEGSSSSS